MNKSDWSCGNLSGVDPGFETEGTSSMGNSPPSKYIPQWPIISQAVMTLYLHHANLILVRKYNLALWPFAHTDTL